jgi:nitrogen fixation NifU-like protein
MAGDIYEDRIMILSQDKTHAHRIEKPSASATVDNPLCGDRVTIDLRLENNRVVEASHHVRGCALCAASATALCANAKDEDIATLIATGDQTTAMLKDGGAGPKGKFEDFAAFGPVAGYKSRHSCVLLPFDALKKALGARGT